MKNVNKKIQSPISLGFQSEKKGRDKKAKNRNYKLSIVSNPFKAMIKNATDSFPEECQGFIFCNPNNGLYTVTASLQFRNPAENGKRMLSSITPEHYMVIKQFAQQNKLELLGVYHSRSEQPARPTEKDKLLAIPDLLYVIISVTKQGKTTLKYWQLDSEDKFTEQFIRFPFSI